MIYLNPFPLFKGEEAFAGGTNLRKGWLQIDFAIGLVLAFFTFLRS
jgi:hypothetical protein